MQSYKLALANMFKDWKTGLIVVIFSIARIIYGWDWIQAGWEKLSWFSDGKHDATPYIQGIIKNIGPAAHRFDPLGINKAVAWIAHNIYLNLPGLTDFVVVIFEILIGLFIILGFNVFWASLVAMFLNTQYFSGGSFNNFGYIWTNLALMKWAKYFEAIGVSGYLRVKKGDILAAPICSKRVTKTS